MNKEYRDELVGFLAQMLTPRPTLRQRFIAWINRLTKKRRRVSASQPPTASESA